MIFDWEFRCIPASVGESESAPCLLFSLKKGHTIKMSIWEENNVCSLGRFPKSCPGFLGLWIILTEQ